MTPAKSITVISSPYHVGVKDVAVGAGPTALIKAGLIAALDGQGFGVEVVELEPVDDYEGEIGRLFELLRRTSITVTRAVDAGSFPIVLSGNCSTAIGVAAGLSGSNEFLRHKITPSCVWFDAHDDYNTPDVLSSGYLDSMPVAMLEGVGWKTLLSSIPNFQPMDLKKSFVHVGMRDVTELERSRVIDAGFSVIWGDTTRQINFESKVRSALEEQHLGSTMIHVDLDCLDTSVGMVNKFSAPGGLLEADLVGCLKMISLKANPASLTIASYDPSFDKSGDIPPVAIRAVVEFVQNLVSRGVLLSNSD
ncbi:hypothetical protein B0J13DRAFT_678351 [Dactylonectria estremocensis]|uniref:Arginase n=1 Tax=Dactylonectria estremocensis TaxID=1079267 RepID=A0A9P9E924_9HYPO|nr:hypothetical protein B0J13DRAFT_678351 [Dactylonectria estremocensis]